MSIAVDYTSPISPSALKAAGVSDVCRYLSWLPNTKVILKPEYDTLTGAGITVHLNWEYYDRDWLSGAAGAKAHATEAVRQARLLGYPSGRVIPGSNDIDMTYTQWVNAGRAYGSIFAQIIRDGGYVPAMYGSYDAIKWCHDEGIMKAFWQSMSTAYSQGRNALQSPYAQLWQRGQLIISGQTVDRDVILQSPLWRGSGLMADAILSNNDLAEALIDGTTSLGFLAGVAPGVAYHQAPERRPAVNGVAPVGIASLQNIMYNLEQIKYALSTPPMLSDEQISELASKLAPITDASLIETALRTVLREGVGV